MRALNTPNGVAFRGGALYVAEINRILDLLIMPDGAMLVSDDRADVIYRVSYNN